MYFFSPWARKRLGMLKKTVGLEENCNCFEALIMQENAVFDSMPEKKISGNMYRECQQCNRVYTVIDDKIEMAEEITFAEITRT